MHLPNYTCVCFQWRHVHHNANYVAYVQMPGFPLCSIGKEGKGGREGRGGRKGERERGGKEREREGRERPYGVKIPRLIPVVTSSPIECFHAMFPHSPLYSR